MHILVTGHTGFKGAWLTLLLKEKGYEVSGVSLSPNFKSMFEFLGISKYLNHDFRIDIRDIDLLKSTIRLIKPDVVIHLAAQSLVLESYKDPILTYETNVNGTLNILQAIYESDSIKASLIVTTDKVYKNNGNSIPYKENYSLGGHDPYSSSKAMADILTQSWMKCFTKSPLSIVRAGNVIGGGDFINSRLIPDVISAIQSGKAPILRNPNFVRPWQHVLDCLNGYILLFEKMIDTGISGEWNFGSEPKVIKKVSDVCNVVLKCMESKLSWTTENTSQYHEEEFLLLDSSKARHELSWSDKLSFEEVISWTTKWYVDFSNNKNGFEITSNQIRNYLSL